MPLYQVKTVYRFVLHADSPSQAYQRAHSMIRAEPGLVLAGVEVWAEKPKRSLLKRLLLGW